MNDLVGRTVVPPFLPSNLCRRNFIAAPLVFPTKLNLSTAKLWQSSSYPHAFRSGPPSSQPSSSFLELLSSSSSHIYTSLSEILPSTGIVRSPTTPSSSYNLFVQNHVINKPAGADDPAVPSGSWFFRKLWFIASVGNPVSACIRFIHRRIIPSITRAFDRILRFVKLSRGN